MARRVGPRMVEALRILAANGGVLPCMMRLAEQVGPYGSTKFGYRTGARLIAHGLVAVDKKHPAASVHGTGAVVLTERGRQVLANEREDTNR